MNTKQNQQFNKEQENSWEAMSPEMKRERFMKESSAKDKTVKGQCTQIMGYPFHK